jgi:hypothetical protein
MLGTEFDFACSEMEHETNVRAAQPQSPIDASRRAPHDCAHISTNEQDQEH